MFGLNYLKVNFFNSYNGFFSHFLNNDSKVKTSYFTVTKSWALIKPHDFINFLKSLYHIEICKLHDVWIFHYQLVHPRTLHREKNKQTKKHLWFKKKILKVKNTSLKLVICFLSILFSVAGACRIKRKAVCFILDNLPNSSWKTLLLISGICCTSEFIEIPPGNLTWGSPGTFLEWQH